MTLAAATPPPTPLFRRRRAPRTSPPICATGSSLLIDSRTQRNLQNSQGLDAGLASRARQAKPDRTVWESRMTAIHKTPKPDGGKCARDIARALVERQGGKQAQPQKAGRIRLRFSSDGLNGIWRASARAAAPCAILLNVWP